MSNELNWIELNWITLFTEGDTLQLKLLNLWPSPKILLYCKIIVSMKKCARSTLFYTAIAFLCVGCWFGSAIQTGGCWRLSPELGVLSSKNKPISGMSEPTIFCTENPRQPTRSPHQKLAIPFKPPNWCEHQRQVGREAIIPITTGSLQGCYNSARLSSSNIAETIGSRPSTTLPLRTASTAPCSQKVVVEDHGNVQDSGTFGSNICQILQHESLKSTSRPPIDTSRIMLSSI